MCSYALILTWCPCICVIYKFIQEKKGDPVLRSGLSQRPSYTTVKAYQFPLFME